MCGKKVAISQSNYIPWKGYFDNIAKVDEFVLYDDMQYTKRDWRNRNKIKTPAGLSWLSIPVEVKGKFFQKISETKISDKHWVTKHLNTLKHNYSKASQFKLMLPLIEEWYEEARELNTISQVNFHFLTKICHYLNINTKISFSSDYKLLEYGKTERLVDLCKQLNAEHYFTGEAAKSYMDESLFYNNGIQLHYYDYSGYKKYRQLYGDFEHYVSVLDVLFNEGDNSRSFLKYSAS